ncbi:hypothetical protein [Polaromonas sp. YR568]|uniref:hypothetical protein n=1 Tax=Polaromonas sp. YR568 TaxID=1855301 RepID=UPI003137B487
MDAQAALALSSGAVDSAMANEMRAPLGVYNVSVSRIFGKVERLCQRLEALFNSTGPNRQGLPTTEMKAVAIDYMELAVYAAAEHVDDVDAIARAYFSNKVLHGRNVHVREFDKLLQRNKRFVAMLANHIKHSHSRLRLCTLDFYHDKRFVPLYGYFVEGAKNGVLRPNGAFHAQHEIFSVTSLPWEILVFVLATSRSLAELVGKVSKVQAGPHKCTSDVLSRAVIAAARLPLYTFGEPHPFERGLIAVSWLGEPLASLESGLYGSLALPWSSSQDHILGALGSTYEGDGVSNNFHLPTPKNVTIKQWR